MPESQNEKSLFFPLPFILAIVIIAGPVLYGAVYTWVSMLLAAILFGAVICYPDCAATIKRLPRPFVCGMLAVAAFILFQCYFSSWNAASTSREFIKWTAYAAGFLLIQLLPCTSVMRLAACLAFVGVFESLYGWFQVASKSERVLWQIKESHRGFVTGTYLNRNHLAGLLELSLGVHLGMLLLAVRERNIKTTGALTVLFAITFLGFIKTGSRAGLTCFAIAWLLFTLALLIKYGRPALPFIALTVALTGMLCFGALKELTGRFLLLEQHGHTWEGRLFVWQDTIRMALENPWLGTGLGTFSWVYPGYQSERVFRGWSHAHNDYLELLSELGVPAFSILVMAFLVLGFKYLESWFHSHSRGDPLSWGIGISLGAFLMHSALDFNMAVPANAMLFIFLWSMGRVLLASSAAETYEK